MLTEQHIADAVLGLASDKPEWAGHASIVLGKLLPVGGLAASFGKCPTLSVAIERLLSDQSAREQLVMVTVSSAEFATNSNGNANILYLQQGEVCSARFVSELAISLLHPGAEKNFNENSLHAPITKQIIFNRRFFEKLAYEIAACRRLKAAPMSDGQEYDAEEAQKRRFEKLGVRPDSRYLNVGVDNQVTWPKEETLVHFDQYKIVLLPKTKDHVQSISIDLIGNRLTMEQARTVINRFLSLMTWCDDHFAVAQDGWAGNPLPCAVPRRNLAFINAGQWYFDRKIPETPEKRQALALYREARNAEQNFLVSYAILNYYKIIELKHKGNNGPREWIKQSYPLVRADVPSGIAQRLDEQRGATPPEKYIHESYRHAVAHSGKNTVSDPDCADELTRLHIGAEVLRALARYFIKNELRVSASPPL